MANEEPWQRLYRYWESKHVDGRIPMRGDIDPPIELPLVIPNVMLIDVINDRFRYRLVGSAIWDRYLQELTGTWIERRNPPKISWRDTLTMVRDDQVARLISTPLPDHSDRSHVAVAMPLRDEAGRTSQILAGTFFAQEFGTDLRVTGRLTVREVLEGGE